LRAFSLVLNPRKTKTFETKFLRPTLVKER
jgi:hypothetical protein